MATDKTGLPSMRLDELVEGNIYNHSKPWHEDFKFVLWLIHPRIPSSDLARDRLQLEKVVCRDPWGFMASLVNSEDNLTLYFLSIGPARDKNSLRLWIVQQKEYEKWQMFDLDSLEPSHRGEDAFKTIRSYFVPPV